MKKILTILIAMILCFCTFSCGDAQEVNAPLTSKQISEIRKVKYYDNQINSDFYYKTSKGIIKKGPDNMDTLIYKSSKIIDLKSFQNNIYFVEEKSSITDFLICKIDQNGKDYKELFWSMELQTPEEEKPLNFQVYNNAIYLLTNKNLYSANISNGEPKILFSGVKDFQIDNYIIYYKNSKSVLYKMSLENNRSEKVFDTKKTKNITVQSYLALGENIYYCDKKGLNVFNGKTSKLILKDTVDFSSLCSYNNELYFIQNINSKSGSKKILSRYDENAKQVVKLIQVDAYVSKPHIVDNFFGYLDSLNAVQTIEIPIVEAKTTTTTTEKSATTKKAKSTTSTNKTTTTKK